MATELTPEEISKDVFFRKLASLSTEMINEHGKTSRWGPCSGRSIYC